MGRGGSIGESIRRMSRRLSITSDKGKETATEVELPAPRLSLHDKIAALEAEKRVENKIISVPATVVPIAAAPIGRRPVPPAAPASPGAERVADGSDAMPAVPGATPRDEDMRRGSVMTMHNFNVCNLNPDDPQKETAIGEEADEASGGHAAPEKPERDQADSGGGAGGGAGGGGDMPSGGNDVVLDMQQKRSVAKAIEMSRLSATFSRDIINSISTSRPIPEDKSRMYYLSVIECDEAKELLNEVAMGVSEGLCPKAPGDLPQCALSMVAEGVPDGPQVYIEKHVAMNPNTVVACGRKKFCELTFPNNPELCSRLHFFIIRLANGNFVLIDVGSLGGIIPAKSTKDAEKMKVPNRPKRLPIQFKLGKSLVLRAGGMVISINTGGMQMFEEMQEKRRRTSQTQGTTLPPA